MHLDEDNVISLLFSSLLLLSSVTPSLVLLHLGVVRALALVRAHVAAGVGDVLSSHFPFSFTGLIEALLMRAGVLAAVRQAVHRGRLRHFLRKERARERA